MIRINNIKIYSNISDLDVMKLTIKKNKINEKDIIEWHIAKKSIDARKKDDIHYNYSIDFKLKNEHKYKKFNTVKPFVLPTIQNNFKSNYNPVIVGAGPSGLFSALTLIKNGITPIIIEQGQPVDERKKDIDIFRKSGILNTFSNVQFGEGGAGTFSDGKLTTGINSPFCKTVLEYFVKFGAPKEILYLSKPHIGTDNLINIIRNIRNFIISNGGKFLFNTKLIDFNIKNNKLNSILVKNVLTSSISEIKTDNVILAIGHSSRDTFETLYKRNFAIEKKNFSVGVRIEHLQKWINNSQYGTLTKLDLPPADYKLAYHSPSGRSCYTFCMCPGGVVMASSSEENTIVTNGMSYFSRSGINSNSAILVNITPNDFLGSSPLAGIYFQKELEKKAFVLGGSNYFAPVQKVGDFLENKKTSSLGIVKPSYLPGVTLSNLNDILPNFVSETLKEGIQFFDTKLKNFANPDSILTGLETRSSSPVKIIRNNKFVSNIEGVYPCGEGARLCWWNYVCKC